MKTIHYYLSPKSPWTYLGHDRLLAMARRHGAVVLAKPMDLGRVFPISGGLPLDKRPTQRQAYRITELKRWSEFLGMPLTIHPKFFPVDDIPAAKMVTSVSMAGDHDAALKLAGALLRGVWAQERDISDPATLVQIADECGLNGATLYSNRESATDLYQRNTNDAIELQVFGAPWYEFNGISYWGQDRLDFLDRALADT